MGRVRRYKKYKACDPASRKFGKEIDTKHDEPPELFEQRTRKLSRERESKWDDEERREHLLQREALRELRMNEQKDRLKEKKIESKRADESMQAFKARVKQEIRKTLVTEVQKMTATAQKRKQRLKERTLKRKGKLEKKSDEDDHGEFFAAENGHIRPSDRGESRTTFREKEEVAFGERAERPPDLHQFTAKFKAAKSKAGQDAHSQQLLQQQQQQGDSSAEEESEEEEEEVQLSKNQRRKKRKAESLAHRSDMDGDDGLEGGVRGSADTALLQRAYPAAVRPAQGGSNSHKQRATNGAGSGKVLQSVVSARNSGGAAPVGVKAQNEMDALRLKVQEAYRQLRDKRRAQI